ncbi:hypothetical protein C0J52_12514 [Blattella germanica]|nr:hypothetical protein C0J52_12514 [Blattella germanica]
MSWKYEKPITIQEALDIINEEENKQQQDRSEIDAIYIAPPEPDILTDEDSGNEEQAGLIDNFNGRQLRANLEIKLKSNMEVSYSNDDISEDNISPNKFSVHSSVVPDDNSQGQENKDVRKSVGSLLMSSMEVSRLEQRAYIKIAVLRGQNARECHAQLLEAVGARALSYRTVARWVAAFESGREATKDKPRTGRPRTVRTDVSRAVIQQCAVAHNPLVSARPFERDEGIRQRSVFRILHTVSTNSTHIA